MERCKTCRWWNDGKHPMRDEYLFFGMCESTQMQADVLAGPTEDPSYLTRSDFGCVHHEPKQLEAGNTSHE